MVDTYRNVLLIYEGLITMNESSRANTFELKDAKEMFCKLLNTEMIPDSNILVRNNHAVLVLPVRDFNKEERVFIHAYVYSNSTKEIINQKEYISKEINDMRDLKELTAQYIGGKNIGKFFSKINRNCRHEIRKTEGNKIFYTGEKEEKCGMLSEAIEFADKSADYVMKSKLGLKHDQDILILDKNNHAAMLTIARSMYDQQKIVALVAIFSKCSNRIIDIKKFVIGYETEKQKAAVANYINIYLNAGSEFEYKIASSFKKDCMYMISDGILYFTGEVENKKECCCSFSDFYNECSQEFMKAILNSRINVEEDTGYYVMEKNEAKKVIKDNKECEKILIRLAESATMQYRTENGINRLGIRERKNNKDVEMLYIKKLSGNKKAEV